MQDCAPPASLAQAAAARRTPALALSLFALALGGFGIGTTEFVTMGLLPDIARGVDASIPSGGHLVSGYALGVVVGAPLLAVLGARLPRKTMLLALMAAFVIGNLASALAPSFDTLLVARFVSGLPHGAFFGIGSVVAASLVAPQRRGWAVSMMMLGLTVANVIGVPVSTFVGQNLGWRSTFLVVTGIGLLTLLAVGRWVPAVPIAVGASARQELRALGRLQVWLALLTGAVGFGGFFAVYSYITPTMTGLAGISESSMPVILALFGVGMTLGNLLGGRLADWSVLRTVYLGLISVVLTLVLFTVTVHHAVPAALTVLLLGGTGSAMIPALQTRLMDVADDAQSLAAALNHSALNIANALGAWLGGLVIARGLGYEAPAWVGAGLAVGGIGVLTVSALVGRRAPDRPGVVPAASGQVHGEEHGLRIATGGGPA